MGILFKIVGGTLVMGAAGYFAISVNRGVELRKQELRRLYSILVQLKSEIQYMCNPLPESFQKMALGARAPFSEWLSKIACLLEENQNISFATAWMKGADYLYQISALQDEDIEFLKELGDKLGSGDITAQLKVIDYVLLQIEENRKQLENEFSQKKKVTVTLSLFCGAMTLLLLL